MRFQAVRRHPTGPSFYSELRAIVGLLFLLVSLGLTQPALAAPITLTFDEYVDGTDITNQYQSVGMTVSGGNILGAIFSPWLANTGPNILISPIGLMTFTLDTTIIGSILGVSAYVSGLSPVGIYAYDIDGNLLGQALTPGPTNNMLLTVASFGNPIASIEIHDGGSEFAIDTLSLFDTPPPGLLPEPTTGVLFGLGLLGLLGVKRSKRPS